MYFPKILDEVLFIMTDQQLKYISKNSVMVGRQDFSYKLIPARLQDDIIQNNTNQIFTWWQTIFVHLKGMYSWCNPILSSHVKTCQITLSHPFLYYNIYHIRKNTTKYIRKQYCNIILICSHFWTRCEMQKYHSYIPCHVNNMLLVQQKMEVL